MFYQVFRIFFSGETRQHSVQYFDTLEDAQKRYFNVIAADLANDQITYNAAYIIDSNGLMVEGRVFDRRIIEVGE